MRRQFPRWIALLLGISLLPVLSAASGPQPESPVHAVDFGADPAVEGDDTAALQKALDAAQRRASRVVLAPGAYRLSASLRLRGVRQSLSGAGLDKTTLMGDTDSFPLLVLEGDRGVEVRDLAFRGSGTNDDTRNRFAAVECRGTRDARLERIAAVGTGYLVFDSAATGTVISDSICEDYGRIGYLAGSGARVSGTRFQNREGWKLSPQMQGIYISAGKSGVRIEGNEFINCGSYAVQLWGSKDGVWTENIVVRLNTFTRCPRVMIVAAGARGPSYRKVSFAQNTIRGTGETSLRIGKFNGSSGNDTALEIRDNVFEDPGPANGIVITPWGTASVAGIRIIGNRFSAPSRSSYSGMIVLDGGRDIVVEGNTLDGIGHDGDQEIVSRGIYCKRGSRLVIRRNTFSFWQNAGKGRSVDGILIGTEVLDAAITGNEFQGSDQDRCFGLRAEGDAIPKGITLSANSADKARTDPRLQ